MKRDSIASKAPERGGSGDLTRWLAAARGGDRVAEGRAVEALYSELRARAERALASERAGHTLQPTALVHEVWMRTLRPGEAWAGRGHFLRIASRAMRRLLVDHARARSTAKRSVGDPAGVAGASALPEGAEVPAGGRAASCRLPASPVDEGLDTLAALDNALLRLGRFDPWLVELVERRFFAGYGLAEISEQEQRSERSLKRDWRSARAFLLREMGRPQGGEEKGEAPDGP